ncbi:MAG: lipopolysaccharide biosynthesis protein [Bryobacteraceae bacterium]
MTESSAHQVHGEAAHTLRQAGGVLVLRGLLLATGFAFVAVIPRLMGPETYGQFSLIQSMTLWFTALSGMGAVSMMTRFVPAFLARGDHAGLRRLVSGMLALRLGNGLAAGLVYAVLASFWLGDLSSLTLLFVAGAIAGRTVGNLPYTLLLGLNQGARWETGELTRRVLGLFFAAAGFSIAGLTGATAGLFAAEAVVIAVGYAWTHEYVSWRDIRIDRAFLEPYLRFSAGFFAANVLMMLFHQGGAAIVKLLAGGYAETGYYHMAFHFYLTVTAAVWRLVCTFGPMLSSLREREQHADLRLWAERLLSFLGVASILGAAAAATHGSWVIRMVAGAQYERVGVMLPVLGLAVIGFVPGALARMLAVTFGAPSASIGGAGLQLAAFALGCSLWVRALGGMGACYAVVLASVFMAAYGTWRIRREIAYSLSAWVISVAIGALLSPILWLAPMNPTLRLASFVSAFLGALTLLRQINWSDWMSLFRQASRRQASSPRRPRSAQ